MRKSLLAVFALAALSSTAALAQPSAPANRNPTPLGRDSAPTSTSRDGGGNAQAAGGEAQRELFCRRDAARRTGYTSADAAGSSREAEYGDAYYACMDQAQDQAEDAGPPPDDRYAGDNYPPPDDRYAQGNYPPPPPLYVEPYPYYYPGYSGFYGPSFGFSFGLGPSYRSGYYGYRGRSYGYRGGYSGSRGGSFGSRGGSSGPRGGGGRRR